MVVVVVGVLVLTIHSKQSHARVQRASGAASASGRSSATATRPKSHLLWPWPRRRRQRRILPRGQRRRPPASRVRCSQGAHRVPTGCPQGARRVLEGCSQLVQCVPVGVLSGESSAFSVPDRVRLTASRAWFHPNASSAMESCCPQYTPSLLYLSILPPGPINPR